MSTEQTAVVAEGNAPRFVVKQMLEPEGTRFGIYRDGKLWEAGYVTKEAADEIAEEMERHAAGWTAYRGWTIHRNFHGRFSIYREGHQSRHNFKSVERAKSEIDAIVG